MIPPIVLAWLSDIPVLVADKLVKSGQVESGRT